MKICPPGRRLPIIVALIAGCALLSSPPANAAMNCYSSIDTSGDITWRPVRKETRKLHFLAPTSPDRPNCPGGEGCELPAFLTGGDQVIANGVGYDAQNKKALICGIYISPKGEMTHGWIDSAGFHGGGNVMSPIDDPGVFGRWTSPAGARITIRPGEKGFYIRIDGSATIGAPGRERTGDISGPAYIGGVGSVAGYSTSHYDGSSRAGFDPPADKAGCRVRFRYTGSYLLVDDNEHCGGQGVTFSGVYVKRSKHR